MAKRQHSKPPHPSCPICAGPRSALGLPLTIPFGIPTCWSAEEALAIFAFIDEMRDKILAVYGADLQHARRQQRQSGPDTPILIPDEDLPF